LINNCENKRLSFGEAACVLSSQRGGTKNFITRAPSSVTDPALILAKVPKPEKAEVLAAFAAHKDEVTAGYVAGAKRS